MSFQDSAPSTDHQSTFDYYVKCLPLTQNPLSLLHICLAGLNVSPVTLRHLNCLSHKNPKTTWALSQDCSSPWITLNLSNSWRSLISDFLCFSPLKGCFREWCVKVIFSFKGRKKKALKKTVFDCWEITLGSTPSLPPCLPHHCSRQLQESNRAKIHWLNGTTVLPGHSAFRWRKTVVQVSHAQTRVALN